MTSWPPRGDCKAGSHGDRVRLLRRSGFVVESLRELLAPTDGGDHPFYGIVSHAVASRWPAAELWEARLSRR